MLTVMSGMDPHMISGNLGWVFVKSWLGCVTPTFYKNKIFVQIKMHIKL
jgi:hypothetical protein